MPSWTDRLWRLGLKLAYCLMRVYWLVVPGETRGAFVAVWHGSRILLIRNSYKRDYTFPGGMIRRGEAPVVAAAREVGEEVGIAVEVAALELEHELTVRHGLRVDHAWFFVCRMATEPVVTIDRREVIWGEFCPLAEALRYPLHPEVRKFLERQPEAAPLLAPRP